MALLPPQAPYLDLLGPELHLLVAVPQPAAPAVAAGQHGAVGGQERRVELLQADATDEQGVFPGRKVEIRSRRMCALRKGDDKLPSVKN